MLAEEKAFQRVMSGTWEGDRAKQYFFGGDIYIYSHRYSCIDLVCIVYSVVLSYVLIGFTCIVDDVE